MVEATTHVGLDVHKQSISVAMLLPGSAKATQWEMRNESGEVRRLVRRLRRDAGGGAVQCAYEAGPCGYVLQRQLARAGVACQVVAASLIPRKPGERIKTDRRDARKLAELLRAGLLTEVRPPSEAEEALRDLCRCREDARVDLMRARHRLSKMLLRRDLRYVEGRPWTQQHRAWLWSLKLEHAAERMALEDYLLAVDQVSTRLATLEAQLKELADQEPYRERVGWLRCLRGIDTITAVSILAELHGFERFERPRQLMAYLGLVPSESSSGASVHRGAITKTGNRHLRRLLTEAAHHCRHRPGVGAALRRRRAGQPAAVIALADRAQQRLHRRYSRLLLGRGLPVQKVVVACARELTGFVWALLYLQPRQLISPGDTARPRRLGPSATARGLRAAAEKTR
ncbi:MAG TPA: IS110 family transposase [Thermoanaerobaculia bacterium]|nr:IS110 family transposase [Thermoanaerobaculia bacterium]